MFEWINRHKIKIIIIMFILLIGVPIITHCLFKINPRHSFWVSTWSAGEFLTFYGSILSFVATVILSILALWQNEIIRYESNKHTELLEEMEKSKSCPFFSVSFLREKINHSNIEIMIQNVSDNIAIDMELSEVDGSLGRSNKFFESLGILKSQETVNIHLRNGFMDAKNIIKLLIQCKDIYGNKRLYDVRGEYNIQKQRYFFAVHKKSDSKEV